MKWFVFIRVKKRDEDYMYAVFFKYTWLDVNIYSSTGRCRFLARASGGRIQEIGVRDQLRLDRFCLHDPEGYGQ